MPSIKPLTPHKEELSPSMFIGLEGDDLISFGSGQPDLPPPKNVFKILPNFSSFKYGPIQGQKHLREALSGEHDVTSENIVITNGASEAMDLCFSTLLEKGDKVLLTRPYYYAYPHLVEINEGVPVYTKLVKGKIDLNDFQESLHGCKAVLINSPSNPTGTIQSPKTLKEVEKICNDLKVYLIFDEVYSNLIYEGEHYSPSGELVVNINSFSKTFAMCGLRVGYLYSNKHEFIKKIVEQKTYKSMNTSILSQEMAFEALKTPKSFKVQQLQIWRKRRDLIYSQLIELGFDLWKPEGAFYVFPKVENAKEMVWNLFKRHKVVTYLGEWFGVQDRIRLSYALKAQKIKEGIKRIRDYLK
jgi:aspartate aminotransferase